MRVNSFILLLVLLCLGSSMCFPATKSAISSPQVQLCGNSLTDHIALVCDHIYNTYRRGEKPFKRRQDALSLFGKKRNKRGVVDECCYKACLISEMAMYCGDNSDEDY